MLVLGIDQASVNGWGLLRAPNLMLASGVAKKPRQIRDVVLLALSLLQPDEALAAVLEDHSKMPLSRNTQYDAKKGRLGARYAGRSAGREYLYPALTAAAVAPEAPSRNTATILGMGAARGAWTQELALTRVPGHGEGVPVTMVEPWVWGLAVLGLPRRTGTEERKRVSVRHATAVLGREPADDNEADAVCIALWGGRNVVLPAPKRRMRA